MTLNVCTYHVLSVTVVKEDGFFKLIESQITMIFFFFRSRDAKSEGINVSLCNGY